MDHDHDKKLELEAKLARCERLAREFPDGVTDKNLRELAEQIKQEMRALDK
jgi:hypothetical protein